jgi:hypothetical protein
MPQKFFWKAEGMGEGGKELGPLLQKILSGLGQCVNIRWPTKAYLKSFLGRCRRCLQGTAFLPAKHKYSKFTHS